MKKNLIIIGLLLYTISSGIFVFWYANEVARVKITILTNPISPPAYAAEYNNEELPDVVENLQEELLIMVEAAMIKTDEVIESIIEASSTEVDAVEKTVVEDIMEDNKKVVEEGELEIIIEDLKIEQEIEVVETNMSKLILHDVPFTSQAPGGDWSDPRLDHGCEEASVYMVMKWINNENIVSKIQSEADIRDLADFAEDNYGHHPDLSVYDVIKILLLDYYNYSDVELVEQFDADDMITTLAEGNVILLPVYGRDLGNPYFTLPGPEQHMIVVNGYDPETEEFITQDPGTSRGKDWRYSADVLYNAIDVYTTGEASEFLGTKAMIIVSKN